MEPPTTCGQQQLLWSGRKRLGGTEYPAVSSYYLSYVSSTAPSLMGYWSNISKGLEPLPFSGWLSMNPSSPLEKCGHWVFSMVLFGNPGSIPKSKKIRLGIEFTFLWAVAFFSSPFLFTHILNGKNYVCAGVFAIYICIGCMYMCKCIGKSWMLKNSNTWYQCKEEEVIFAQDA